MSSPNTPPAAPPSACVLCGNQQPVCPDHPGAPRYELEHGTPAYCDWRRDHPVSTWPAEWITRAMIPLHIPSRDELLTELVEATREHPSPYLVGLINDAYDRDPAATVELVRHVTRNHRIRSPLGVIYTRLKRKP